MHLAPRIPGGHFFSRVSLSERGTTRSLLLVSVTGFYTEDETKWLRWSFSFFSFAVSIEKINQTRENFFITFPASGGLTKILGFESSLLHVWKYKTLPLLFDDFDVPCQDHLCPEMLSSITSRCSGNETRHERAAKIEPTEM